MTIGYLHIDPGARITVEHHSHPGMVGSFQLIICNEQGGFEFQLGSIDIAQLDQVLYSAKAARDQYQLARYRQENEPCPTPSPDSGTPSRKPANGSSGPPEDPSAV